MIIEIVAIIFSAAVTYWVYTITWTYTYWKRKNVEYIEPSFPFGNIENPFTRTQYIGIWLKNIYDEFKKRGAVGGGIFAFASPAYVVVDPEILKHIMQKDFQYFVDRGFYYNEKDDPLSAHLFAIGGSKWRHLRTKLTPTFTSGKMKMMFQTLIRCSKQMDEAMDTYSKKKEPIDIRDILACFTTDVIGSCAFGLECNCFKSPDSEFRKYGRKIFEFSKLNGVKLSFAFHNQNIARKLGLTFFPRDATSFFKKVVEDTVKYRETNNFVRKDMLQLLIDIKKEDTANNEKPLTMEEIAAQAFVFFAAGFETSSTTMSFTLYELATNPDIQEKVRDEIKQTLDKYNGEITYDSIMEMKYMGQVIEETLRKYPPVAYLTRQCTQDYKLPGTDTVIDKGTKIMISTLGLHRDAEYFPDPEKFDPERFSDENKKYIVPYTYIPFGEGPRICLGLRFGIMQTKVGLTVLLKNYKFTVNKKTTLPLHMNRLSFTLLTTGGIWLDTQKVED